MAHPDNFRINCASYTKHATSDGVSHHGTPTKRELQYLPLWLKHCYCHLQAIKEGIRQSTADNPDNNGGRRGPDVSAKLGELPGLPATSSETCRLIFFLPPLGRKATTPTLCRTKPYALERPSTRRQRGGSFLLSGLRCVPRPGLGLQAVYADTAGSKGPRDGEYGGEAEGEDDSACNGRVAVGGEEAEVKERRRGPPHEEGHEGVEANVTYDHPCEQQGDLQTGRHKTELPR